MFIVDRVFIYKIINNCIISKDKNHKNGIQEYNRQ